MIWIIGSSGMLGQELMTVLKQHGLDCIGSDKEVDCTSLDALEGFSRGKPIRWIVNCAAYTAVDKAEDEMEIAGRLNADAPGTIALLASRIGATIIHFSTDYVFNGAGIPLPDGTLRPYREDDPVDPAGVYGTSKARGEQNVRENNPQHYILRTAWLYGKGGPNFVYTMLKLMQIKDSLGVVADQFGSPTWTYDLAKAIHGIIVSPKKNYGTFHFSGQGVCNWYEFAMEIQKRAHDLGLLSRIIPIEPLTTEQYPTKAKRPAWSVLDKTRISQVFGIMPPGWADSLEQFLELLAVNISNAEMTKFWRT